MPNGGPSDVRGRHVTGIATDALNRVVIVSTLKGGLHVCILVVFQSGMFSLLKRFFPVLRLPNYETCPRSHRTSFDNGYLTSSREWAARCDL